MANRDLVVYAMCRGDRGPWRAGLSVSKKVGSAVVRNTVKRRLREAIRARGGVPPGWDVVVIARPGCDAVSFERLSRSVGELVEKAVRRGGERRGGRKEARVRCGKGRASRKG